MCNLYVFGLKMSPADLHMAQPQVEVRQRISQSVWYWQLTGNFPKSNERHDLSEKCLVCCCCNRGISTDAMTHAQQAHV
jgi:hypothetical protein